MKYFVIFLVLISLVSINQAFAECGVPYDSAFHWLNLPCHDTGQTDEQRKADWAEFYYFKGSEWMEYKTNEFETLMNDGLSEERLQEWLGHGYDYVPENWYFWNYYQLFGSNPPQTKQRPVEIPLLEKQTCDESCKARITASINPYTCTKKPDSQNYECAHQSAMQLTILLTSTDNTGKEMTFRPTESTVSLGINNTIRWHNTSYKTTISNQETVYDSISIPFNYIKYQVLDKVGNYTFYDESNPNVKIPINIVPLDENFNAGKPITKHGYFSDVRFQIFRTNTDSQNFIHNIAIQNNNSINVTLDNTMDAQYAVHDNFDTLESAKLSVGETITSGCSYHHDAYSRLFYHTLEKINSQNDTVEFKETVDYVQGNKCESLYSDSARLVETIHKNNILQSPLNQFDSGIPFDEIQCKENLVLIQKYDGTPACVTESTKTKLVERGWSTSENRIKISDTSKSIHHKIDGASCSNGTIIPSYNDTRIIPVLMMQPNSTGTICITYDFPYDWESYPNKDLYPDHKFHFDLIDIDSEHFTITANPEWIDTRTISAGDNVTVTYKIHADSNSQGLYDTVIPYGNCTRYPMAVGYDESEITSSDFPEAPRIPPCVLVFSGEKHVSLVSEMDYFELDYR